MPNYQLYNLQLKTYYPLAGLLLASDDKHDMVIHLGSFLAASHPLRSEDPTKNILYEGASFTLWNTAEGSWFRFEDGTEFFIDHSLKELWVSWRYPLTLEDALCYLLGPIFGFILRLRGVIGLHASCIVVNDQATAFVGAAGAGKSTTAAAFSQLGFAVLADDLTALLDKDAKFWVQPSYPYLRLWPSSVKMLFGTENALPPLTPNWEKCYLDLAECGCFQQQPRPLSAIYLLAEHEAAEVAPRLEELPASEAFIQLLAQTNANYLPLKDQRVREFDFIKTLLARVPVKRVIPHADPARLNQLCALLLNDINQLSSAVWQADVQPC